MSELIPVGDGVVPNSAQTAPNEIASESHGLEAELNVLKESIASMKADQTRTLDMFQQMFAHIEQDRAQPTASTATEQTAPAGPQMPASEDLDIMSMSQAMDAMTQVISHTVGQQVAAAIQPVTEQIEAVSKEFHTNSAQDQIGRARGSFKDFDEWQDEIRAEVENMKVPDLAKAYQLARGANPEKAARMDTKYNVTATTPSAEQELQKFFPQRPGQKGGVPKMGNLKVRDGVSAAFAQHGGDILKLQEAAGDDHFQLAG
ncbi:hypothetical protein LCGC14_1477010 [marine sediment metagenome]|uniref:Uncharacterized protein n=1 Tax=marine sediment metagenome TaxID=412755 RepID=A0A0F9JBE2_9ZZZZ